MPRHSRPTGFDSSLPLLTTSANPENEGSSTTPMSSAPPASTKSFACLNCAARKTKCDKERPACTACRRRQLTCVYEDATVGAGSRKRRAIEDANGRLERFERILAQHGLAAAEEGKPQTPSSAATADGDGSTAHELLSMVSAETVPAPTGRLVVDANNSRYINSNLWREVENNGLGEIAEEELFGVAADSAGSTAFPAASLSRGLLGSTESLIEYHPPAADAIRLWEIYSMNVEPLYKFLHSPSVKILVETACQDVSLVIPADQCLLFAIYLLAIFSMDEDTCLTKFGQTRALLISQYDYSIRQALFNASWLSTNHMSTLLAFVMYLCVVRRQTDTRSLWIWTGIGIRIMQRMGIHRDGEAMGLCRIDVETRRRLYWHLVSVDTYAGRVSGTSDTGPPKTWDTKLPSNINDDQIYPNMNESQNVPIRPGATDMIFSLVRIKLGTLFTIQGPTIASCNPYKPAWDITEKMIDSVENEIESQFLRYCDPVEPVHTLTLMTARSAIAAARLRQRMPLLAHKSLGREVERREFYSLTRRIMDTENHSFTNPVIQPFIWYVRASFRWDALICLLAALARPHFLTPDECEGGWKRVSDFFTHHAEIFEARNILQRTVGRMTLMAWLANPPPYQGLEPDYIATLRTLHADTVPVAPSWPADGDAANSGATSTLPSEEEGSYDITMFLNSSVFGSDNVWEGLLDGIFQ
ncbi:hypothetical protein BX600DRAFT_416183 [Xylariales sp. PMI_506]|nr:hypothetical protein BX600DRAFT_416183 [Xylariales sp. PMI_506]